MMNNSDKIILDLCAGTKGMSRYYEEAGYDVRALTLPNQNVFGFFPPPNVYGVVAGPPCTEFSYAKSWHNSKRNMAAGMRIVRECLRIIETCIHNAWADGDVKSFRFWALENPARGYLERFIGKPALIFNPCDYGDQWTKKTALWGWFNNPKKNPVEPISRNFAHDKFLLPLPDDYIIPTGSTRRACRRAITPPGFAKAFYEANR